MPTSLNISNSGPQGTACRVIQSSGSEAEQVFCGFGLISCIGANILSGHFFAY